MLLVIAVLVVVALAVQRLGPPRAGDPAPVLHRVGGDEGGAVLASVPTVRVTVEDGTLVRGFAQDGSPTFVLELHAWHAFAGTELERRLGEPVAIGETVLGPESFDRFGAAAVDRSGRRVAVTATAYALLTTASVVTLLDTRTGALDVVRPVAFGEVEGLVWSGGGRYVASALATARAEGDGLRVDDVAARARVVQLEGADVVEALAERPAGDPRDYLPRFRDLEWTGAATLAFTVDDPAGGSPLRLALDVGSDTLRPRVSSGR